MTCTLPRHLLFGSLSSGYIGRTRDLVKWCKVW